MENRGIGYADLPLRDIRCLDDVPPLGPAVGMRADTVDCGIRDVLLLWHTRLFLLRATQ